MAYTIIAACKLLPLFETTLFDYKISVCAMKFS